MLNKVKYLLLVIGLLFLIPACTTEPVEPIDIDAIVEARVAEALETVAAEVAAVKAAAVIAAAAATAEVAEQAAAATAEVAEQAAAAAVTAAQQLAAEAEAVRVKAAAEAAAAYVASPEGIAAAQEAALIEEFSEGVICLTDNGYVFWEARNRIAAARESRVLGQELNPYLPDGYCPAGTEFIP
jgi:hypothetical protein